jgi:hypothetical protein
MTHHVEELRKKLNRMKALVNTVKAGVNSRSVAMTRGEIMNIYNSMNNHFHAVAGGPNGRAAAEVMNKAQKIVYG